MSVWPEGRGGEGLSERGTRFEWIPSMSSVHAIEQYDTFRDDGGGLALDEGIRRYVLILRANGIETFESCEGGEGHCYPEPTIRFFGQNTEGFRAFAIAVQNGLPVATLRRYYSVEDGELVGPQWEMTFRTADPSP